MDVFIAIRNLLSQCKVPFEVFVHEPVRTSEEAAAVRGNPLGMGAKAMVMRYEGKFCMAVISGEKRIDMKRLKQILKTKSLSFATPEEVKNVTGCEVGGVPPFGNLFGIPVYLDRHILQYEKIDFNAGLKTHSIELASRDYLKIVKPIQEDFCKG